MVDNIKSYMNQDIFHFAKPLNLRAGKKQQQVNMKGNPTMSITQLNYGIKMMRHNNTEKKQYPFLPELNVKIGF